MSVKNRRTHTYKLQVGAVFFRWTIVGSPTRRFSPKGKPRAVYPCRCECGTTKEVAAGRLLRSLTMSCGCIALERASAKTSTHRETRTPLWKTWRNMRDRCNPSRCLKRYGGRGIRVCDEWMSSYEAFRDWALANGYRDDLTIERKDINGNYEPENCTWITSYEQSLNRSTTKWITAFGERKPLASWVRDERCVVSGPLLSYRMRHGVDPETAMSTPPRKLRNA